MSIVVVTGGMGGAGTRAAFSGLGMAVCESAELAAPFVALDGAAENLLGSSNNSVTGTRATGTLIAAVNGSALATTVSGEAFTVTFSGREEVPETGTSLLMHYLTPWASPSSARHLKKREKKKKVECWDVAWKALLALELT
jgi:hypothetical protein